MNVTKIDGLTKRLRDAEGDFVLVLRLSFTSAVSLSLFVFVVCAAALFVVLCFLCFVFFCFLFFSFFFFFFFFSLFFSSPLHLFSFVLFLLFPSSLSLSLLLFLFFSFSFLFLFLSFSSLFLSFLLPFFSFSSSLLLFLFFSSSLPLFLSCSLLLFLSSSLFDSLFPFFFRFFSFSHSFLLFPQTEQELVAASSGAVLGADFYASLLLLQLCEGELSSARHAWLRVPSEHRSGSVLKAVHAVLAALWKGGKQAPSHISHNV